MYVCLPSLIPLLSSPSSMEMNILHGRGGAGSADASKLDVASFDAMFNGVSLQSLLLDETPLPDFPSQSCSFIVPPNSSSLFPPFPRLPGSYCFTEDFPAFPVSAPKSEPVSTPEFTPESAQFQNTLPFILYSIEETKLNQPPPELVAHELTRVNSSLYGSSDRFGLTPKNSAARRRRRVSDRIQWLQKLMPWEKKMDIATMLEEAYKYIKFLQAQVAALQSMPAYSPCYWPQPQLQDIPYVGGDCDLNEVYGSLWRLNRQQLLQVVVNSRGSQTALYSKGRCVVSAEQLVLLKEIAERRLVIQQMKLGSSSTSNTYYTEG